MEKVAFVNPETKEELSFFVLEETRLNGARYLLVAEEEDGDCDAYLLKETAAEGEDALYEMVEEDAELEALGRIFAELLEDADIRL